MVLPTKTFLSTGLLAATLALGLSSVACGPIVPVSPTWKDDIRPLMVSRCIRCHSSPFRVDPKQPASLPVPSAAGASLYNFDFATFAEVSAPENAGSFAFLKMAHLSCSGKGTHLMPPPPAERLEGWQIDMLHAWADLPQ